MCLISIFSNASSVLRRLTETRLGNGLKVMNEGEEFAGLTLLARKCRGHCSLWMRHPFSGLHLAQKWKLTDRMHWHRHATCVCAEIRCVATTWPRTKSLANKLNVMTNACINSTDRYAICRLSRWLMGNKRRGGLNDELQVLWWSSW